tara:strand:+ start:224 stop:733 length:510 start_codon:yes stop_codon:yes gene_type:complete
LNKENLIPEKELYNFEVISIGIQHLNQCFELDKISLQGIWTKDQWQKELLNKKNLCLGIFLDSKIIAIGCGSIIYETLEINAIAVNPNEQKKGYGEKVLMFLLKKAKYSGAKKAILEVKSSNFAAKSLYKKFGFKIIATRKKYYKDGIDALVFCLFFKTRHLTSPKQYG